MIKILDNLQADDWVVSLSGDSWHAEVDLGKSIRLYGVDHGSQRMINRTFQVHDQANYDWKQSARIVSISDLTVVLSDRGSRKRISIPVFFSLNRK